MFFARLLFLYNVMMRQPTNNRNSIASTPDTSPLWVKTSLVLPKLWQSYSVASYILSSLREERLGEKGGAFLNGKEGRVGFRPVLLNNK